MLADVDVQTVRQERQITKDEGESGEPADNSTVFVDDGPERVGVTDVGANYVILRAFENSLGDGEPCPVRTSKDKKGGDVYAVGDRT